MNRIAVHPAIFSRLKSISDATGQTMTAMANEALARLVGLEGIPLDEIFGEPEKTENHENTRESACLCEQKANKKRTKSEQKANKKRTKV